MAGRRRGLGERVPLGWAPRRTVAGGERVTRGRAAPQNLEGEHRDPREPSRGEQQRQGAERAAAVHAQAHDDPDERRDDPNEEQQRSPRLLGRERRNALQWPFGTAQVPPGPQEAAEPDDTDGHGPVERTLGAA